MNGLPTAESLLGPTDSAVGKPFIYYGAKIMIFGRLHGLCILCLWLDPLPQQFEVSDWRLEECGFKTQHLQATFEPRLAQKFKTKFKD